MWAINPIPHETIDHNGQKNCSGVASHHTST